jgi:hypothetical protein
MWMSGTGRLSHQLMTMVGIGMVAFIINRQALATPQTAQEIRDLLDFIEHSECRFVRNGTEYSGPRARAHLQQKLDYLEGKNRVNSAEDFIDLAATKSSMSGRLYEVRCSEGAEPASIWLKRELERQRQFH